MTEPRRTLLLVRCERVRDVDWGVDGFRISTKHHSWRDAETAGSPVDPRVWSAQTWTLMRAFQLDSDERAAADCLVLGPTQESRGGEETAGCVDVHRLRRARNRFDRQVGGGCAY